MKALAAPLTSAVDSVCVMTQNESGRKSVDEGHEILHESLNEGNMKDAGMWFKLVCCTQVTAGAGRRNWLMQSMVGRAGHAVATGARV